jgi:hypothetical protein
MQLAHPAAHSRSLLLTHFFGLSGNLSCLRELIRHGAVVRWHFGGLCVILRAGRNLSKRKEHWKHMANLVRPADFWDRLKIGGQAAIAIGGDESFAG